MSPHPVQAPTYDALAQVVKGLVMYSLMEHQLGHATDIAVMVSDTGCTVADNGRGHSPGREVGGQPYLSVMREVIEPNADGKTGNSVSARLRPELCGGLDRGALHQWLREVATCNPGLRLSFNGEPVASTSAD